MSAFKAFEEIEAWKKARELTREIYGVTDTGSFARDFGLRDQIRRASVSIMSNIAEGFEKGGTKEFIQFLSMAKGSAGEARSQLFVALDQKYITQEECDRLISRVLEISRTINGLMTYLKKSNLKGSKYK